MKKLTKFQINPEKLMKNAELLMLRGGYSSWSCIVRCTGYSEDGFKMSSNCPPADEVCAEWECIDFFSKQFPNCSCACSLS